MSNRNPTVAGRLPPTTDALLDDDTRPYFLWWTDATVGQLKEHLAASDPEERAYWMGALLREANRRDVWLFVNTDEIRALWPRLIRYLGRSRQMWAWLLQRISALALVVLIVLHVTLPYKLVIQFLLLLTVTFHATLGLRVILLDFNLVSMRYHRALAWGLPVLGLVVLFFVWRSIY